MIYRKGGRRKWHKPDNKPSESPILLVGFFYPVASDGPILRPHISRSVVPTWPNTSIMRLEARSSSRPRHWGDETHYAYFFDEALIVEHLKYAHSPLVATVRQFLFKASDGSQVAAVARKCRYKLFAANAIHLILI